MDDLLLPLFPLEVVLLPQESLPLHIFEERYKDMIAESLEAQARGTGQEEFGIVLAKDEKMETVGCSAHIVKVIERYEDGRLDIMTLGRRRFEVLFTNEKKSYIRGGVEFFDDDVEATAPSRELAQRTIELFRKVSARLDKTRELPDDFPRPEQPLSFQIAAPLPLALDFKQELLENRSESERLRLLNRGIARLIRQIDQVEKARTKAGGNGKLRST
jgi:Lon protease-like protein